MSWFTALGWAFLTVVFFTVFKNLYEIGFVQFALQLALVLAVITAVIKLIGVFI